MRFHFLIAIAIFFMELNARAEHRIEVCTLPLSEIVADIAKPFVSGLQHMFVRGNDKSGLNFQPQDPFDIFGGKAQIGRQNYETAMCKPLIATNSAQKYNVIWQRLVNAMHELANTNQYDIFEKNCQWATRTVLKAVGFKVPKAIERAICDSQGC